MNRVHWSSLILSTLVALVLASACGAAPATVPESGNVVISVQRFEELLDAARKDPDPDPDPDEPPPLEASLESLCDHAVHTTL